MIREYDIERVNNLLKVTILLEELPKWINPHNKSDILRAVADQEEAKEYREAQKLKQEQEFIDKFYGYFRDGDDEKCDSIEEMNQLVLKRMGYKLMELDEDDLKEVEEMEFDEFVHWLNKTINKSGILEKCYLEKCYIEDSLLDIIEGNTHHLKSCDKELLLSICKVMALESGGTKKNIYDRILANFGIEEG